MDKNNYICNPMEVLAIDPGNEVSAYVVWNGNIVKEKGIVDNVILLGIISSWIATFPDSNKMVVIEMVASYGMPVGKTVFDTAFWIGRFYQKASGLATLVYRKDVKMHLCQSMRAKDSNVRQALIDRFGAPGTKKEPNLVYNDSEEKMAKDKWSALAIAVTYLDKIKTK